MEYWYQILNCLPTKRDSLAYKRLRRVWADQTNFKKKLGAVDQIHRSFVPKSEMNLQISIWENFSIFDPKAFTEAFLQMAGIDFPIPDFKSIQWSYEWETKESDRVYIADIVIKIDTTSSNFLVIVECKTNDQSGKLGQKDLMISNYLNLDVFKIFSNRKALVYCVHTAIKKDLPTQVINPLNLKWEAISWEEVVALQLKLADEMDLPKPLKSFVLEALKSQFRRNGLAIPTTFQTNYFDNEVRAIQQMPFSQILAMDIPEPLKGYICGVLLNEFPDASRTDLPFQYLYSEPNQNREIGSKYQKQHEREERLWELNLEEELGQ